MSLRGFSVRRSESSDAEQITALLQKNHCPVFGRVNVLHLLEKANLCVSLVSDSDLVLAHASFLDHPIEGLVDQREWEELVQCISGTSRYTPLNSLFLHLFVSDASFAAEASLEIIRAVYRAVPKLKFILLLSPHLHKLDQVLEQIFEPLQSGSDLKCVAQVCSREQHWPQLSIRPARVEDHDDVMQIFSEQTMLQTIMNKPFFLTELMEKQSERNHSAVCEINGAVVGFISVTTTINVKNLLRLYDLSQCEGAFPEHSGQSEEGKLRTDQSEEGRLQTDKPESSREEPGAAQTEPLSHSHKAFSVQFFTIHKDYESRSVDFLPYLFKQFPDRDLCLVTVPTMAPELPLVHNFSRISPRDPPGPVHELYALHRIALRPVVVRRALPSDRPLVVDLVRGLDHGNVLLKDLDQFYQTETDQDCVGVQSFVVQVGPQVLGVVVIRDEQEVEFLRAHYYLEDFIYFSLHSYHQHAALRHFVLHWSQRHCRQLVFREVLRLSTRTCLYHRVYLRDLHMSCCVDLDFLLDCAVPVRPRPQIDFPLEELGQNAPSNLITDPQGGGQTPFSLFLVSRKLTLEQKVVVNARITVCGASETGLSLIQTLCCSPHLRFNNLTLVSTYGYHGDDEYLHFFSTSHALSHRQGALFPLSSLKTIRGSVVAIDRKCKHVQVCSDRKSSTAAPSGDWLRYDLLLLCSGLQYQVPSVIGSEPVPLNLWTLEDPEDREEVQHWVQDQLRSDRDQGPEQRPDQDEDQGPEQRPDQDQDQEPEQRPDQDEDQGPEQRPDQDQEEGPEKRPDQDQDQGPEQRPDQDQDQKPEQRPDQDQEEGPEKRPDQDQDQGPEQRPDQDQDQEPEQRPDQDQDQGPEQRPDQDQDQGPEQRPDQDQEEGPEQRPDQDQDQRTEQRPQEKDINRDQDQDPERGADRDIDQDPAPTLDYKPDQDPDQKPTQGLDRRADLDQRENQGHMVVFGHNIDAFTTVQALLSLGLPGPQIHLVLAPSESSPWLLDPAVDQAVFRIMETVQIQVYKNCELQTIRTQKNRVTGVTFSCRGETIEICCGALVCLCSPGLDHRMLRALLKSFLVFDGRLVVDSCFHTSDPWIYAAGTMTKYSRKYYSEEWSHQRYCSTQIGQDFARQILLFFDPTSKPREESDLLPLYDRPKVTGGVLPGALCFLHVTKPSPSELNSVPYLKDSVLVTGDLASGSYFRLQLDDCERVETITCVSHKPLPLHNLLCLNGQQQSLLGNLSRGQVSDLYSFFRQSWCWAIFHDRFTDFQLELRALANYSAAETHGQEQRPSEDLDPETRTEIRSAVVRYLSYNRNLLPMFALPGHL